MENNGRGIFYGVIGVATLVVAIIGATFAYFSAQAANNNAINVQSTTVNLSLVESGEGIGNNFYASGLIPVNSANANFPKYPGLQVKDASHVGHGTCTDDNGDPICGIYSFGVTNPANVAQTVYGSLEVKAIDFPVNTTTPGKTNLHYAVFKGKASDVLNKYSVSGTPKTFDAANDGDLLVEKTAFGTGTEIHDSKEGSPQRNWANTATLLSPNETAYYTVIVWLEEAGANNSGDQDKKFKAGIKFDTSAGGSGVTGVLGTA